VEEDSVDSLKPADIRSAVVYILHYGRPLYKGEGEPEPGLFFFYFSFAPTFDYVFFFLISGGYFFSDFFFSEPEEPVASPTVSLTDPAPTPTAPSATEKAPVPKSDPSPAPNKPAFVPQTAQEDESFPSISMEDEPEESPAGKDEDKGKEKDKQESGSWDSCESVTEEELPRMFFFLEAHPYRVLFLEIKSDIFHLFFQR
jgi:hypothetical protein